MAEQDERFEWHESWNEVGLENFDEWITLADAGMLYLKHLLIRLHKQGRVVLDWETVAADLQTISRHRAIVRAREADVLDLIASNPEKYRAIPREPAVRTPIVVPAPVAEPVAPEVVANG